MKTEIFNSYLEFLRRREKSTNGVSKQFAEENPNYESENSTNKGCWNCSDCSHCSRCSDCFDCFGGDEGIVVPKIDDIHAKILEVTSKPGALDMSDWHTCGTTHCRAGWVVTLAGEEGAKLESDTSTEFAAMMIYKESSDIRVSPAQFYETDDVARKDIARCAEIEAQKSRQDKP